MRKQIINRHEAGFTLVEVLVVVLILGIMAAIVTISVNSGRDKAIARACTVAANQLKAAIDLYYVDQGGNYPGSRTSGDFTRTELNTALVTGYMPVLPTYKADGGSKDYYLVASVVASASGNYAAVTGYKDSAGASPFSPVCSRP